MPGCSIVNPTDTPNRCLKKGFGAGAAAQRAGKLKRKPKRKSKKPKRQRRRSGFTREQLLKFKPQARAGTQNLSSIARGVGVRVTKANGTRKTKATLITEILAAQ